MELAAFIRLRHGPHFVWSAVLADGDASLLHHGFGPMFLNMGRLLDPLLRC